MPKQHCQSCDMPFDKDPQNGGTNADGSRSGEYCSFCYGSGEFYWQGDDVKAFQAMVVTQMRKDGWWGPIAWLLTRRIPKLKRWQS